MIAELLFPRFTEAGESQIGALVIGAKDVTGNQMKKLNSLLPSFADARYRLGTLRIEVDVPPELHEKVAMHKLAKRIRSVILKGLGVKAGLCPVTSSAKVLDVIRRG
ncbi:hypothetical protein KGQ72_01260 [Patescibacteria group bacterium]|nr:hypothetical protein [Patescibacteria group bacterium]MBU6491125.1 hypothetical protein [Patescibacteria group bacterium]